MTKQIFSIALLAYPDVSRSALYGLAELFEVSNLAAEEQGVEIKFETRIVQGESETFFCELILIPPSISPDRHYLNPDIWITDWLKKSHSKGTVLASACAGAFVLAASGVIEERRVTTHWALASLFEKKYPSIKVDSEQILISQGDVVTSAGVMAWLDLGLEMVSRFASPAVMRQVGKLLVVDTGGREQRYYAQFSPGMNHGDAQVVKAQLYIHANYSNSVAISELADECHLTTRTLLRRFTKATGYKPLQYLQRYRIQMACNLLESSNLSFDAIAHQVGYEDVGACRNLFQKIIGLTPKMFRQRFVKD
ncbi:transcriptional regulator, araC family [Vibrio ishigakensis]|uniref:Transcriptional regulator, araC family n=1 Tax=Vibrio ishigakensis TaxID=1481914 RepID=A0A0B8P6Z5_9VIBR|nr:helix-turn-helix domain-containing protein [Vibrio ishigakensis]GAM58983.1 transcriptional regulator, araC family [Vibrio ishigakensis]